MAKNKKKKRGRVVIEEERGNLFSHLHPEIRKSVWVVVFLGLAVILILAAAGQAGPLGNKVYSFFSTLFGWGYYLLPAASFLLAFSLVAPEEERAWSLTFVGVFLFVVSGLGFIDIVFPGNGGLTGSIIGALESPFGAIASIVITFTILIASFLIVLNRPFKFAAVLQFLKPAPSEDKVKVKMPESDDEEHSDEEDEEDENEEEEEEDSPDDEEEEEISKPPKRSFITAAKRIGDYKLPPPKLLASSIEKPTIGDLRANANIIARTLDSFGIPVEMGEIQVGPTVTRYTLKPAEGVKLSRITTLNSDLALALAAHPIRIEAPIPGKSLVGIEVPNKAAALVRLGSLLAYPDFQKPDPLIFVLGRDVSGEPVFSDIAKMPHLLIAGATGSGKSITIHSLLLSLLYKNSPDTLRMILIDPKRVELSVYNDIPHLISPVIIDNKKAISALKWAISEMERRYELLLEAGVRDIKSYNQKQEEHLPYILIVVDELADLMATYSREVEGAIIRLAQMSRATGIHLVVSTQRPSVEVITGLIKANITSRIALQVASNVDSRTILDTSGAEKLLGNGDLLFISAESSKPKRIQGAYVTEKEIRNVVDFIKKNNDLTGGDDIDLDLNNNATPSLVEFDEYDNDEDELYDEAVRAVREAKKASASYLQRRLKVGYARAARLLDIMEERGIVGPGDGAKPREVYFDGDDDEQAVEDNF